LAQVATFSRSAITIILRKETLRKVCTEM
jgi:hypothetical protein